MRGVWAVVYVIYVAPSAGAGLDLEPTDCDALQTVEACNQCYAKACFYLQIVAESLAGLNHDDVEKWKREAASAAMFCNKVPDGVHGLGSARTKNWNWCVAFATNDKKRGVDRGLTCDRAGQK